MNNSCSACSTSRICPEGMAYTKEKLSTAPKKAIICCEGACIKGEVARIAANILAYRLQRNSTVRICLGDATTGNSGMLDLIHRAPEVISIEGCPLQCGINILQNRVPDLHATIIDTSKLYDFDRSKYFEIFDLPREQLEAYALAVATHIENNYFNKQ
jgi:uncharacterized metal-binding protein